MNPSDQRSGDEKRNNVPLTPAANAPNSVRSIFDVPPPLKRIFDHFPVKEYEPNDLPVRAPTGRHVHQLHVFIDDDGARRGKCSWNPGCLKWQVRDPWCFAQRW
jgi:metaxin